MAGIKGLSFIDHGFKRSEYSGTRVVDIPSTKLMSTSLKNAITWHKHGEGLMVHTDQGF
ncbi:transposase-like protein [Corynebacterium diphtheriae BH8]|nr:transposase-like protein [Corynebacterium diphtheriae BH8]